MKMLQIYTINLVDILLALTQNWKQDYELRDMHCVLLNVQSQRCFLKSYIEYIIST